MSVTLESVLKQLGDEAQLVGGRIVVYRDGKHTDVGGLGMADAVFTLTESGKKLLGDAPKKAEVPEKTLDKVISKVTGKKATAEDSEE
jgi:hypothetical protein